VLGEVRERVDLGKGREMTAGQLCETFGFNKEKQWTPVGDLSGGERRRLQLLRLLMDEPNVLFLDEPTNDLDIETLTVLEDFLDGWPGTLVVVSHDRYFLERVTDVVYGLLDDGRISLLPGGVDEYLQRRSSSSPPSRGQVSADDLAGQVPPRGGRSATSARAGSAEERAARKTLARVDKRLEQLAAREAELNDEVLAHASDHERLTAISTELSAVAAEREALEAEWLEAAEVLE